MLWRAAEEVRVTCMAKCPLAYPSLAEIVDCWNPNRRSSGDLDKIRETCRGACAYSVTEVLMDLENRHGVGFAHATQEHILVRLRRPIPSRSSPAPQPVRMRWQTRRAMSRRIRQKWRTRCALIWAMSLLDKKFTQREWRGYWQHLKTI